MIGFFKKYFFEIIFLLLFVILIPIYSKINFYQNDDWNRNSTLERFMKYDFSLLDVTATTFYSQGILGFFWSQVFGTKKIPILTLIITILNSYILFKILENNLTFRKSTIFLISLIFLFNPLNAYSSIGFMTENYLMLYFLLALYFFTIFEKSKSFKNLIFSNIFLVLAFFAKQNSIILNFGMVVYFLYKRKFKELYVQSAFTFSTILGYFFLFQRTSEMREKDTQLINILNFDYNFSLFYGILIYLSFFTLPIIFITFVQQIKKNNLKLILKHIFFVIVFYFLLNNYFKPGLISWEEFPYFENTFERTGFLPRTVDGTKYQFKYNYDLYVYIDFFSKIGVSMFLSLIIFNYKKVNIFYFFTLLFGVGILFLVSEFYDRYILLLLPIFILIILSISKEGLILRISALSFVLFLGYFSYFLSSDFILTHNYMWSKSEELYSKGVPKEEIYASGAWRRFYKNQSKGYLFSYDSFEKNPGLKEKYILLEEKSIDFYGNLFINPKIYLYQLKN
jgi:hypothetical protein